MKTATRGDGFSDHFPQPRVTVGVKEKLQWPLQAKAIVAFCPLCQLKKKKRAKEYLINVATLVKHIEVVTFWIFLWGLTTNLTQASKFILF